MRLTQKLFGWIYRAFDRDPGPFLAFRVGCDGSGLTWWVEDGILTLQPVGGSAAALVVDLSLYDIAGAVNLITAQPGYQVSALCGPDLSALSALVLLDATGDVSQSNGDHLYGYTNPNWAYFEAVAAELVLARQQIQAMPAEMATTSADGEWLDLLGAYYKVPRLSGEADPQYGRRIPVEVLRPRSNNKAIEAALTEYLGQKAQVTDVVAYGAASPVFNGFLFDGSRVFNATATVIRCLFDVATGYDLLGGADPVGFGGFISGFVDRFRAAGTFMRALTILDPTLGDAVGAVPTDAMAPLAVSVTLADQPATPTDGGAALALSMGLSLSDAVAAVPDDTADSLVLMGNYLFDGGRTFDGRWPFMGGCEVHETMSGTIISVNFVTKLLTQDDVALLTEDGQFLLAN